ncbi:MAG TPA: DUF5985 family protein [Baekduia sp.]|nr:DUF5985 family protein [Baekduia sp.]
MATAVYVLCAVASTACAVLLLRAHRRAPASLLLWSFGCFALLALNNVLLVVDLEVVPDTDLSALRAGSALAGLLLLLGGLIVDATGGQRRR